MKELGTKLFDFAFNPVSILKVKIYMLNVCRNWFKIACQNVNFIWNSQKTYRTEQLCYRLLSSLIRSGILASSPIFVTFLTIFLGVYLILLDTSPRLEPAVIALMFTVSIAGTIHCLIPQSDQCLTEIYEFCVLPWEILLCLHVYMHVVVNISLLYLKI